MKTAIIMIALLVSTMFAFPIITAQSGAVSTTNARISDLGNRDSDLIGDLNGDRLVNDDDLQLLLNAWGKCSMVSVEHGCFADLDNDGTVGVSDLLILLGNWYNPVNDAKSVVVARPAAISGISGSDRSSVTITDIETSSGLEITDLEEFDESKERPITSPVIAIYGWGYEISPTVAETIPTVVAETISDLEEMKFILLMKRNVVSISENGEKTVHTERRYNGKISTSDGRILHVRGTDLSSLDVFGIKKQSAVTAPAIKAVSSVTDLSNVLGKANFDFGKKELRIDLYNGEKKFFKLVEVNRRYVNKIAPGKIVSEIAKEKAPFWRNLFPQRASDSSVSDEVSEYGLIEEESPFELDRAEEESVYVEERPKTDNRDFLRALFDRIFRRNR